MLDDYVAPPYTLRALYPHNRHLSAKVRAFAELCSCLTKLDGTDGRRAARCPRMPKIIDLKAYDGFERRVERLGLTPIVDEIKALVTGFELDISEGKKHDNGAAVIREILDARFAATAGWKIIKSGGIDWTKCIRHNGAEVCIGVELQISARSDLLTNDLTHLVRAIELGDIDAGVIVIPADRTAYFLTDRCPRYSYALDHVDRAKAQFSPLLLISIGHDGIGAALPKRRTNLGREP